MATWKIAALTVLGLYLSCKPAKLNTDQWNSSEELQTTSPDNATPDDSPPKSEGQPKEAQNPQPQEELRKEAVFETLVDGEISRAERVGGGKSDCVSIFFGGYGARLSDTQNWAKGFVNTGKHCTLVYAVTGPRSVSYNPPDLRISKLVADLEAQNAGETLDLIAHSSGVFVANEFVEQRQATRSLSQLSFYSLDGVSTAPFSHQFKRFVGVYATRNGARSQNAAAMLSIAENVDMKPSAGCGSAWCLHFAVIRKAPTGDLAADYAASDIVAGFVK